MKIVLDIFLYCIDFSHKKKIINFFKNNFKNKTITIIDVGAHEGETIKLFLKYFNIKKIISYEASKINYKKLNKFDNSKIILNNIALGNEEKELEFFQTSESSSSTFRKINYDSKYFKRKKKILSFFNMKEYIIKSELIKLKTLEGEFIRLDLKDVDILKIDTEGFEFDVIKGAKDKIKSIKYILFEHHYDQMIIKDYKFSQINNYLKQQNFKKIIKFKMPLRKTFEYIYVNKELE
jgi:FkbM family methyltransferase